jgi:chromate transporter
VDLALFFLRLGTVAFGGPAAHIAMMQEHLVERRKWLTRDEYLDLVGAANLIPGPSSTEVAIHVGFRLAGWVGLLLAGACFILPAFLMVMAIAWAYVRFGHLPQIASILYGVKPVVIAIVALALLRLAQTAARTRLLAGLGLLATALALCDVNPLLVIFGAGAAMGVTRSVADRKTAGARTLVVLLLIVLGLAGAPLPLGRLAAAGTTPGLRPLFWVFVKLGSVVYGSGYVLLAFLRAELVARRGWLSAAQLLDAVAVGQVTPGPVFTTATFIGYVLAGPAGAVVATAGIFLPAFVFVGVSGPLIPRLRRSPIAGAFLDGVNIASLALMASVTWQLGRAALIDPLTSELAAMSALLLFRYRINSAWLILGAALIGLLGSGSLHAGIRP